MSLHAAKLAAHANASNVTGASFAYWDGMELHSAVTGLRNSVTGDPVTPDTLMHIGSITKVMNAVLTLQLVDDGMIDLDDPVARHLPELRLRDHEALRGITCRMLLDHSSGIDCDMLGDHGPDRERISDLIERCRDFGQLHAPGGGPSYSNLGSVIAGYLAQKLRGRSWYTLMKERVFAPLGMTQALADPIEAPRFRHSIGDLTDMTTGKLAQTTRPFLPLSFAPSGTTVMASANDLLKFGRALAAGGIGPDGARVLSAELTELMTRPSKKLVSPDASCGLGWFLLPGDVLTHSGGGPGVASFLFVHKTTGKALTLLTNSDRGAALGQLMLEPIVATWTGLPRKAAGVEVPAPADLSPYTGVFGNNLLHSTFSTQAGSLSWSVQMTTELYDRGDRPSPPAPLYATGPSRFETRAAPGMRGTELVFGDPDASGRMQSVYYGYRLVKRLS